MKNTDFKLQKKKGGGGALHQASLVSLNFPSSSFTCLSRSQRSLFPGNHSLSLAEGSFLLPMSLLIATHYFGALTSPSLGLLTNACWWLHSELNGDFLGAGQPCGVPQDSCVHAHTCRHTLAHWHVLSASHTLLLVCCKTGRMLMFPGQM